MDQYSKQATHIVIDDVFALVDRASVMISEEMMGIPSSVVIEAISRDIAESPLMDTYSMQREILLSI